MSSNRRDTIHISADNRIKALKGSTIESVAVDLVAIETEEVGKILRTSTPDQLRKKRAEVRTKRGSPKSLKESASKRTLNN